MIHVAGIYNTTETLKLLYDRADGDVIQTAMSQTPVVSGIVLQLWKHMIWHQRRTMSRHVSHEALSNMQLLDITCDLFTHWACSATVRSTTSTTDLHPNVPIKQDMCCSVEVLLSTNTGEKNKNELPRHRLFSLQLIPELTESEYCPLSPLKRSRRFILSLSHTHCPATINTCQTRAANV